MKHRTDRYDRLRKFLKLTKFGDDIHLLRADRHEIDGRVGCFDSHLQLYRHCLQRGCEYALILEDDIVFDLEQVAECVKNANHIMKTYPDWCKINCHDYGVVRVLETLTPHIYRALCVGNQCYFISKTAMQKALDTGITKNHIDVQQLIDFENNTFLITPPMIRIYASVSDNTNENIFTNICCMISQQTELAQTLFHDICMKCHNNALRPCHEVVSTIWFNSLKVEYNAGNKSSGIKLCDSTISLITDPV